MAIYQLELVRRAVECADESAIKNADQAVAYLLRHCFSLDGMCREAVWAVYLDSEMRPIGHFLVGVGGMDHVPIDVKMVLGTALMAGAKNIVIAHNHPNGRTDPSPADVRETERLRKAAGIVGLELTDHIVLGETHYFSFMEEVVKRIRYGKAS